MVEWFSEIFNNISNAFYITFITDARYMVFVEGLTNTFLITIFAVLIGTPVGVLIAIIRSYSDQSGKLKLLNGVCKSYIALIRGIPIMVQLLIMFFIVFKNLDNALLVAIIGYAINSSAYVAEIVRSGIMAVDKGQSEAGRSLGLTSGKTMFLIVIPQAIKNILPALGNEFIAVLKETSVVGAITVVDITRASTQVSGVSYEYTMPLFTIALVYFGLVMGITALLRILERRLAKSDRS